MVNELSYKKCTVMIKDSTDYLGNNCVVVSENDSIEQVTHYYPFGAVYADAGLSPGFQKYKYTGKELYLTHGLNTYDHGARQNYSILGVWDRIDPMCEKYYNVSPYVVCRDNPLLYYDLNGKWPRFLLKKHPEGFYSIKSPVAHLLSLTTGVSERMISGVRIFEGRIPFADAITKPEGDYGSISLVASYFDDKQDGQNAYAWLDILSHEIGHLPQISASNSLTDFGMSILEGKPTKASEGLKKLNYYMLFAISYSVHGLKHDDSKLEQEAEKGRKKYFFFRNKVNKRHGKDYLENLIKANGNNNWKIEQINKLWNDNR